jgi:hypothetical protein
VCQEFRKDGIRHVDVLREITEYDADPAFVAKKFIKMFRKSGIRKVLVYCDPTGMNGPIKQLKLSNLGMAVETLERSGYFDVTVMTPKTIYPIIDRFNSMNWMMKDGNDYVRLHFNPSVKHAISGAERVKWNRQGKKEDEQEDFKAREKGRNEVFWPGLTHHMAALGYFMVEEHPMIPFHKREDPFAVFPDAGISTVIRNNEEIIRTEYSPDQIASLERSYRRDMNRYGDDDAIYGGGKSEAPLVRVRGRVS